jgi:hypothetical protein
LGVLGVHGKLVKYVVHSCKRKKLKKIYFSSHKLPKQQSTNFWSQGILGVKVQSWKKKFFSQCSRGTLEFWGAKKPFFRIDMKWTSLDEFLGELGTCEQNLMPTQGVEPWKNHQFPQGVMLKYTFKGRF